MDARSDITCASYSMELQLPVALISPEQRPSPAGELCSFLRLKGYHRLITCCCAEHPGGGL